MSVEFWLTSLIIVATPGTGVLYTLAAGITRGARASVVAAAGCTLGIVPHLAAAIFGAAALLHASGIAFAVLKYLGVAYLLYMAWNTLSDDQDLTVRTDEAEHSTRKTITSAVLINILNPKLTIFFFAFLPQFVDTANANALPRMLQLSGIFMLLTFVIFAAYGVCAAAVREQVIARPRVLAGLRRVFAATFVALGARLALTRQ